MDFVADIFQWAFVLIGGPVVIYEIFVRKPRERRDALQDSYNRGFEDGRAEVKREGEEYRAGVRDAQRAKNYPPATQG